MNPMARCQEQLRFRHLSRWSSTLVTELQNKLTQEDLTLLHCVRFHQPYVEVPTVRQLQ